MIDQPKDVREEDKLDEKIISEYPKSDWDKSSKGALNFVDRSDEQIMQSLKKQK